MKNYVFYIVCGGTRIEWRGLTETEAKKMYRITERRQPHNVDAFGWEAV